METEQLILHSAQEFNILPLTSRCDAKCVFCGHRYNPPQVRIVEIPPRTLEEVERTLLFLDGNKKIVIGESATNIIEGEPFSHPQFPQIIKLIREKYPHTVISLTTNGHRINRGMIHILQEAMPVEINVSLNSATVRGRKILMGEREGQAEKGIKSVELLHRAGIPFHGSMVAMPHLVGWADLRTTIDYLCQCGALTVRILMAGYGKNACSELKFIPEVMHRELADFIYPLAETASCPLLLEPPMINDLKPVTAGALRGSKAYQAGIKRGDLILDINGRIPRSRVEAWELAQEPGKIHIKVEREGRVLELAWQNKRNEKSGLVMEYDFDMERWDRIESMVKRLSGPAVMLCSLLAQNTLKALKKTVRQKELLNIQPVNNNFFGGSIGAAGLLTINDFYTAYGEYREIKDRPELILLPREAFDYLGRDLTGRSYKELEEKAGVQVIVI